MFSVTGMRRIFLFCFISSVLCRERRYYNFNYRAPLNQTPIYSHNDVNQQVSLFTPDKYDYRELTNLGIPVRGNKYLEFEVKACKNVYVALFLTDGKLYEIVIGGWGNRKSCLRNRKKGYCMKEHKGRVLHCSRFRKFWISWANKTVTVGTGQKQGSDRKIIMKYQSDESIEVKSIGVCTENGATGSWKISKAPDSPPLGSSTTLATTPHIVTDSSPQLVSDSSTPQLVSDSSPQRSSHSGSADKAISTPSRYDYLSLDPYGVPVPHKGYFTFNVKACSDAHVVLHLENGRLFEVVLGGWGNRKSCLRQRKLGFCMKEYNGRVLSCFEFRTFWISWTHDQILVASADRALTRSNVLLEYQSPVSVDVKSVGISTGWGSTGVWRLSGNENIYIGISGMIADIQCQYCCYRRGRTRDICILKFCSNRWKRC